MKPLPLVLPHRPYQPIIKPGCLLRYKDWHEEKLQASQQALKLTHQLSEEEIQASEYPLWRTIMCNTKGHEEDDSQLQ